MNSRLRTAAVAVLAVFAVLPTADAAIVVGLVLDPLTTAGSSPDVSSIYSGLGTWHLFAVDNNDDDFGISTYNVQLTGATAIRNTAPLARIQDVDGGVQSSGFDMLRSPNGLAESSIHAAQSLPDQSPYLFTGLGQESSNFAAKAAAALPGSTVLGGSTSSSWGNYNSISPLNGKNWLFLAEGTYDPGVIPTISQAGFTVFADPTTHRSGFTTTTIVPEPITPTLLTPEYLDHLAAPPPPVHVEPAPIPEPAPQQPVIVTSPPAGDPTPPPAASVDPQESELSGLIIHPPTIDEGWTVFVEPTYLSWPTNGLIYLLDPTDPSTPFLARPMMLPFNANEFSGLQFSMATGAPEFLTQTDVSYDGQNQVGVSDGQWKLLSTGSGVDHDGYSVARFAMADGAAMQDASPTPEPAGLALVGLALVGALGILRRHRA